MPQKLFPSSEVQKLTNKYKPLSKEEEEKWIEEYKRTKSDKSTMVLLNGVSKVFTHAINSNENRFIMGVPDAEYDDIFNQMVLMFFKELPKFDPSKSKLNTWVTWVITPLVRTPVKVMGNKFASSQNVVNIDKKINPHGDTIADFISDDDVDLEDDYKKGNKKEDLMHSIKKLPKGEQEIILNLFGFVAPKKEWQSKTGKINASSIARDKGLTPLQMRTVISKILKKLSSDLK
jgi:DNA-directed RNA polymerase specialized sigma subunit